MRHVQQVTAGLPAGTLNLTYDDLAERYAETMRRLCDHLGLAPFVPKQPLSRQRQRGRWDYVENADEVRTFLSAQGLSAMV